MNNATTQHFKNFTNKFSLTKTLRFELVPELPESELQKLFDAWKNEKGYESLNDITRQDKTEWFLRYTAAGSALRERDVERDKAFKLFKYLVTEMHTRYLENTLSALAENSEIAEQLQGLVKQIKEISNLDANNENHKQQISNLTSKINTAKKDIADKLKESKGLLCKGNALRLFDKEITWKYLVGKGGSNEDLAILLQDVSEEQIRQEFQDILADDEQLTFKIGDEEKTVFAVFAGWKTYCKPFYDIRLNAYKGDGYDAESGDNVITGNHGQVITRILDANAELFAQNFNRIEKQFGTDELKRELHDIIQSVDGAPGNVLEPSGYVHALSQSGIDTYNKVVAEVNGYLNQEFGKEASFLKKLHKQILGRPEGEKYDPFIEIVTLGELQDYLWEKEDERFGDKSFVQYAFENLSDSKFDFTELLNMAERAVSADDEALREIVLDANQLSHIGNTVFGSWSFFREMYLRVAQDLAEMEGVNEALEEATKKFLSENQTTLYDLREVMRYEITNDDGERQPVVHAQDTVEAVRKSPFNFSEAFVGQLSDNDALFNILLSVAEHYRTLQDGRDLHTAQEEKSLRDRDKVCDNECAEHNSLSQLRDEAEQFSHGHIGDGTAVISQSERKQYMQLLNTLFDRFNALNRFATVFVTDLEKTDDYKTSTMRTALALNPRKNNINKMFDAVRNYATKQATVEDKVKLTFEESSLAKGWGYNTTDYRIRLLRKGSEYYVAVIPIQKNIRLYYKAAFKESAYDLSDFEVLLYYQLKSKTFFGSTWKGMAKEREAENIPTSYGKTLEKFGIKKTNRIIGDLLLQKSIRAGYVDAYKEKFSGIIDRINDGFYDYHLTPDEFLREFERRYGYSFKGRTKGVTKEQKVKQALSLLRDTVPSELFNHVATSYWENKLESTQDKSIVKDGVVGTFILTYDISLLEPYWYFTRWEKYNSDYGKDENHTAIDELYVKAVNDLKKGTFFLFKLHSKDFSQDKDSDKSRDLQTEYWKSVLVSSTNTPENQLSGGAEIFFREALPESEREEVQEEELKNPKTDKKPFHKRRFTRDKILFHVPIELNRISEGKQNLNKDIADYFAEQSNGEVIGVDRGEKHLAYYCRLRADGSIAECDTLNNVGQRKIKKEGSDEIEDAGPIPYQRTLDKREKARLDARRTWGVIEQIKDLKKGYVSQVVRKLADMIVDNNAMLVMENLNHGFKRGRIRIEKSVYQQLENALLNKLQYFVREKTPEGVRNALQLVGNVGPQYKWGTQMGAVFYTDAKFTSKTCPHCGFRKRGVDYLHKATKFKEHIEKGGFRIFWEQERNRFRIEYRWDNKELNSQELLGGDGYEVIYSDIDRSYWNKRDHRVESIDTTKLIKGAFKSDIDWNNIAPDEDITEHIAHHGKLAKTLSKTLMNLRFDDPERSEDDIKRDVLQCPKCYFDTRNPAEMAPHLAQITNADAVGAYNIARRGLMIRQKLQEGKRSSQDLKVTLKEWDEYTK